VQQHNKSFIESERMYYDAVAPILRDYVNLDKQSKKKKQLFLKRWTLGLMI
jgi:hypothetical protein